MRIRTLVVFAVLTLVGCTTTSNCKDDDNNSVSILPIIGLIGMAVDGDDKDDYEYLFEDDDDCCCKKCK